MALEFETVVSTSVPKILKKERKSQRLGQRKWKVDLFYSYPYAGVATKNTFHEPSTSFLPTCKLSSTAIWSILLQNGSIPTSFAIAWTHLVSLLFCHLADCQSLRDICKGMRAIRGGLNHLGIRHALHTLFSINDFPPIDIHVSDGKNA